MTTAPAIGIDQGIARVGAYGGPSRRTYGVLGDGVNRAARLMTSAGPGEILVANEVRRSSRRRLTFEDLAPIAVKGHAEPLAVSRLVGRPVGTGMIEFGPLVGRNAELARLTRIMDGVISGPGGVVLIEGEPGVGKSHLVDEARRRLLARHDVTWLAVSADGERPGTLAPFLPVLRDLFFLDLATDDGARRSLFDLGVDQRVKELQGVDSTDAQVTASRVDDLRSYLAALVGIRWDGSAFEEHEPGTRLERCLEAVAGYLHSESLLRPLVVHVRDAHQLDAESLRLVELLALAGTDGRLCVVLDRRPDTTPLPVTPERTIDLEPMDRQGVAAMIEGILGTSATPELCEHIHHRTAGNALFVEQLVVDLERRDRLVRDQVGRLTLADFGATELPVTLNAALLSRLDHLDPAVTRVVQAASVLGEVFERDVLRDMSVVAADQLDPLLADAGADGVWSSVDGQRFRFRHALLRDAAYGMQLDDHLRSQHRLAARAVVRCRGRRETSPEVARHLRMAGTHLLAAAVFRRAAVEATETSRLREAVRHYEAALEQAALAGCGTMVETALHQGAAVAAAALGDHAAALEHLRRVLGGAHLAPADEATGRILMGEVLHRLGRPRESAVEYEAALVTLQDAPDVLCASRIYAGLAMVHGQLGELDEAVELAEMALILAQGDDEGEARAHQRIGQIQWCRNQHQESVFHGLAALERYPRADDRRARAAVHNNLGLAYASLGRRDEAMVEFKVAVDDFDRTGSEHGLACALDNLAQQYARCGANDEAMVHLERAVAILARIGMGPDGVVAAMWQGGCW
jgi:tetratricopeptide (TPR) repeat protein